MESEKNPTFSKERSFRRINVFSRRRLSSENAPRKGDDFPDVVANRKHQPAAKAIVEFAITAFFVTQFHQPAREQFPPAIAFLARPLPQRIPTLRRVTALPRFRDVPAYSPRLQIIARRRAPVALEQIFVKPFCCFRVQSQ